VTTELNPQHPLVQQALPGYGSGYEGLPVDEDEEYEYDEDDEYDYEDDDSFEDDGEAAVAAEQPAEVEHQQYIGADRR
jgi:hypothetical protein